MSLKHPFFLTVDLKTYCYFSVNYCNCTYIVCICTYIVCICIILYVYGNVCMCLCARC